jgi:hypothetical protein
MNNQSQQYTPKYRVFSAIALMASTIALAEEVETALPDWNRPVYRPAEAQRLKEPALPPLDPNPPVGSFAFQGADDSQDPAPPYIYLKGRDVGRDLASPTRSITGDGLPDTWFRLYTRKLGFYIKRGGGYYIKDMILQTKGYPFRRWDTVNNSSYPLLQVFVKGQRINSANGSIAGFNPPENGTIDLFIADDGLIATRHIPMELIIVSLDGEIRLNVNLHNLRDTKID